MEIVICAMKAAQLVLVPIPINVCNASNPISIITTHVQPSAGKDSIKIST